VRKIKLLTQFKKDYRREQSGSNAKLLDGELNEVLTKLASDEQLPRHRFDHSLKGRWQDCRDCHVGPDRVLIYRKPDDKTLELVRLGSHSELGW
jgi:mRNA interferase YafQ